MAEICSTNYSNVLIQDICRQGNLVELMVYITGGTFNANTRYLMATLNKLKPMKRQLIALAHVDGTTNATLDVRTDGNMYIYVANGGGYYSATFTYITNDY